MRYNCLKLLTEDIKPDRALFQKPNHLNLFLYLSNPGRLQSHLPSTRNRKSTATVL